MATDVFDEVFSAVQAAPDEGTSFGIEDVLAEVQALQRRENATAYRMSGSAAAIQRGLLMRNGKKFKLTKAAVSDAVVEKVRKYNEDHAVRATDAIDIKAKKAVKSKGRGGYKKLLAPAALRLCWGRVQDVNVKHACSLKRARLMLARHKKKRRAPGVDASRASSVAQLTLTSRGPPQSKRCALFYQLA